MKTNVFVAVGSLIVGIIIGLVFRTVLFPPPPPPPPLKGPCDQSHPNDHCIDVYVDTVGGRPQIRTIGDEKVKKAGAIFWIIKTQDYTFSASGVDFANIGSKSDQYKAPDGEFINCKPMPSDATIFKCEDTYQHYNPPITYGYKITVDNPAGTAAASLDPFIVNG
jgi:hypothetical protein